MIRDNIKSVNHINTSLHGVGILFSASRYSSPIFTAIWFIMKGLLKLNMSQILHSRSDTDEFCK